MKAIYRAAAPRPRAYYLDLEMDSVTADEIILPEDNRGIETGLLDNYGRPLFRYRETVKFGFVP